MKRLSTFPTAMRSVELYLLKQPLAITCIQFFRCMLHLKSRRGPNPNPFAGNILIPYLRFAYLELFGASFVVHRFDLFWEGRDMASKQGSAPPGSQPITSSFKYTEDVTKDARRTPAKRPTSAPASGSAAPAVPKAGQKPAAPAGLPPPPPTEISPSTAPAPTAAATTKAPKRRGFFSKLFGGKKKADKDAAPAGAEDQKVKSSCFPPPRKQGEFTNLQPASAPAAPAPAPAAKLPPAPSALARAPSARNAPAPAEIAPAAQSPAKAPVTTQRLVRITTKTGTCTDAGTDADVSIILIGSNCRTAELSLSNKGINNFEKGMVGSACIFAYNK